MIKSYCKILLLLICIGSQSLVLGALKITTSTAPLTNIISSLTGDIASINTLQSSGGCPHHYQFRPSDIDKLMGAEYFFYIDPNFDQFAHKMAQKFSGKTIKISDIKQLNFKASNGEHNWHFWLNLDNVEQLGLAVKEILSRDHPELKETLQENYRNFKEQINQMRLSKQKAWEQYPHILLVSTSLTHFFSDIREEINISHLPTLQKNSLRSHAQFEDIVNNNPKAPIVIDHHQDNGFYAKYSNPLIIIDADNWPVKGISCTDDYSFNNN